MKRKVYYSRLKELVANNPRTSSMSVAQLAREIGISRGTIYNWFKAETIPFDERPDETALKIARYFKKKRLEDAYRTAEEEVNSVAPGRRAFQSIGTR